MARLEDRYGVRLLNRTSRAVSLTGAGQRLFAQGEAIQAAIADACLETVDGIPRGMLRITAPDALGQRIILPVVTKFQRTWPDVRLQVSFSDTVSRIIEDGFDLDIRVGVTTPDATLISRTLTVRKPCCARRPHI